MEDVPLVEFMYLVFRCMPSESYCRQLRSLLLYLSYVFWALINSLVCWFCMRALGLSFRFFTEPFAYPDWPVWNGYFQVKLAWGLIILLHTIISALFTSSLIFLKYFKSHFSPLSHTGCFFNKSISRTFYCHACFIEMLYFVAAPIVFF